VGKGRGFSGLKTTDSTDLSKGESAQMWESGADLADFKTTDSTDLSKGESAQMWERGADLADTNLVKPNSYHLRHLNHLPIITRLVSISVFIHEYRLGMWARATQYRAGTWPDAFSDDDSYTKVSLNVQGPLSVRSTKPWNQAHKGLAEFSSDPYSV
jgi:hypothetical protein